MSDAPRSTRPIPEEWPELYSAAEVAASEGIVSNWANHSLFRELEGLVRPLGRVPIINNAFYAYGFAACGIARFLNDEDSRSQVVKRGADLLHNASMFQDGHLTAFNTHICDLAGAFEPAIAAGYNSSPKEVQLLGNYLISVSRRRYKNWLDPGVTYDTRESVLDQMLDRETPFIQRGLRALTASPEHILYTILEARGVDTHKGDMPTAEDINKLRDPSIKRLARRLCTLTSSVSFGKDGPVIDVGDEAVEFRAPVNSRPSFLSPSRKLIPADNDYDAHRTLPMVCPALHINGVVPLVMDITIDMLDLARQQVENRSAAI